jgi:hypothetical protein
MIRKVLKAGCLSIVMYEGDVCSYLGPLKGSSLSHRKLSDETEYNPPSLIPDDGN